MVFLGSLKIINNISYILSFHDKYGEQQYLSIFLYVLINNNVFTGIYLLLYTNIAHINSLNWIQIISHINQSVTSAKICQSMTSSGPKYVSLWHQPGKNMSVYDISRAKICQSMTSARSKIIQSMMCFYEFPTYLSKKIEIARTCSYTRVIIHVIQNRFDASSNYDIIMNATQNVLSPHGFYKMTCHLHQLFLALVFYLIYSSHILVSFIMTISSQ